MEQDFKQLIDCNNGILYKIGRSFSDNEEDFRDLFQEMLIQLWQSFPSFRGASQASTWLYRVALNTALSYRKKQRRQVSMFVGDSEASNLAAQLQTQDNADSEGRIDLLYRCINRLNKDERAIILLFLEEKSYEEIAEIIGITVNLVGVKLYRIRKRLHQLLLELGYANV